MGGGYRMINIFPFDCLRYNSLTLDRTRIRSTVGENDAYFGGNANGVYGQQQVTTGYCVNNNNIQFNCLQNDGSGFYIIQNWEPATGNAVHCYAYENDDCHANDKSPEFDAYFMPGNSESQNTWSLPANLDWLVSKITQYNNKTIHNNNHNSSRLLLS